MTSRGERPLFGPAGRWLLAGALLLLGVVALTRLEITYLPERELPELNVRLSLPQPQNLDELTRRWLVPLEESIRSLGGVRSSTGWVFARGAELRLRLEPGASARAKAARLESELTSLRRALPERASLWVSPRGEGAAGVDLVLWLGEAEGSQSSPGSSREASSARVSPVENRRRVQAHADALAALPEVRSVEMAGLAEPTLWIVPHDPQAAIEIERQIADAFTHSRLGRVRREGRQLGVEQRDPLAGIPLERLRVTVGGSSAALASVADLRWQQEDPRRSFRIDAREGVALFLEREPEVSPLRLRRALDRYLDRSGLRSSAQVVLDESEPLRRMLARALMGLVAASLLLALLGTLAVDRPSAAVLAATPAIGVAAVLNAYLLLEISLDVTTVPAILLAAAGALGAQTLRLTDRGAPRLRRRHDALLLLLFVAAAATLPVAVALAGREIAPLLGAPARAFLVALAAALLGALLLPAGHAALHRSGSSRSRRTTRFLLRQAPTIVLLVTTATFAFLVLFGDRFSPVTGRLTPALGDLEVTLRFPDGTSLADARERVATVEDHLRRKAWVASQWSFYGRDSGTVRVAVHRDRRKQPELERLARRLDAELTGVPAAIHSRALAGSSGSEPVRLAGSIESRADTDENATFLRLVLRSPRLAPLLLARHRVIEAAASRGVGQRWIQSEWGEPAPVLELRPLPTAGAQSIDRLEQELRRRLASGLSRPLGARGEASWRVQATDAPALPGEVAPRAALLRVTEGGAARGPAATRAALEPASLVSIETVETPPALRRQQGRFVLPMTVTLHWRAKGQREHYRAEILRILRMHPLPAGVELELPEIERWWWDREQIEMFRVMLTLPLLLLVLSICVLDSPLAGLMQLLPAAGALGATSVALALHADRTDELTLLGLGAATALTVALTLAWAGRLVAPARRGAGPLSRETEALVRLAPIVALGTVALLALPSVGLDAARDPWVGPVENAATLAVTGLLLTMVLTPALLRVGPLLREHRSPEYRRRADPPRWRESFPITQAATPDAPSLAVRNLTKVYHPGRAEAVRALGPVSFDLGPGIVGLLGPNGAGKTTLLRLLCGLLEPTRGRIEFHGVPIEAANLDRFRTRIGFLPQGFNAWAGFTARDFLDYWALERGIREWKDRQREVDRVLEWVDLTDAAERRVRDFSGGMQRRIGIARALLGDPPILIVDEPTTGLDVESRNRLRRSLLAVASERIVLFSTHIASDVAAAAHRILVLDHGRLLWDGSAQTLLASAHGRVVEAIVDDAELRELGRTELITTRVRTPHGVRVRVVLRPSTRLQGATTVQPNLEEAYLALVTEAGGDSLAAAGTAALLDSWTGNPEEDDPDEDNPAQNGAGNRKDKP